MRTAQPPKGWEETDFTVVEVRDAYMLRNQTSCGIQFRQAASSAPRVPEAVPVRMPGIPQAGWIPPGGVVALRWDTISPREIMLRPLNGDGSAGPMRWSAAMSPDQLGDAILRLVSEDGMRTQLLKVTVTVDESQRRLEVWEVGPEEPSPYRLSNASSLLVAVQQVTA